MYIPDFSSSFSRRSMAPPRLPLDKSSFTLDTSGVVGFFGGDEAVSAAVVSVHIYRNRRWLGWYNCPGSYQVAKHYALLAKSRFLHNSRPDVYADPATLFDFNGRTGPKFSAAYSGTIIEETGHLASLVMEAASTLEAKDVEGRKTRPIGLTIVHLNHDPESRIFPENMPDARYPFLASIPIGVSIATCVVCGTFQDWYSFSMILLGILSNGISCFVIGSGHFVFAHPWFPEGLPPGDGILVSDKGVVILKGPESAVSCITRGRFSLDFSDSAYEWIALCSVLLTIQLIAQLLLIPQGSLLGQIMFITSVGVSWIYNLWLSVSLDKEKTTIQWDLLFNSILRKPTMTKYLLGTRTTMAVFVLLVLQPAEPARILSELLPNDTTVWKIWKETLVRRLPNLEFSDVDWELDELGHADRALLKVLFDDAAATYEGYVKHFAVD